MDISTDLLRNREYDVLGRADAESTQPPLYRSCALDWIWCCNSHFFLWIIERLRGAEVRCGCAAAVTAPESTRRRIIPFFWQRRANAPLVRLKLI